MSVDVGPGLILKSFIVGLGARIAALFLSGAIARYYLCDIQWPFKGVVFT
ncbi:MAG: hypothetical protein P8L84_07290 [Methylococcaceae bacterium]|nr:hypothetical protein [Methylococcaceae bacterium]